MSSMPGTESRGAGSNGWLWAALLLSLAALGGSLYLSMGMELKACPLCFYQRTFMMSLVAVLGLGLCFGAGPRLGLLALPLATAGLGVACFHVLLELRGTFECPAGIFGFGSAPMQSLAMFVVVFVLVLADVLQKRIIAAGLAALVLGGLLGLASSTSNPPLRAVPKERYTAAPDECRPPFRGP